MSSDYRNRRRRGGRGRRRSPENTNNNRQSKKKDESFLQTLIGRIFDKIGWIFGKKPTAAKIGARNGKPAKRNEPIIKDRKKKVPFEVTEDDITTEKLYVGNLPYEAGESELFDLFEKEGQVRNVEVVTDRSGTRSKGFGFVEMTHLESAKKAAVKLNRTDFMGRELIVSSAKTDRR